MNWTAQRIGQLFVMQLVSGIKGRYALIDENSVLRLFYSHFPNLMQTTPLA